MLPTCSSCRRKTSRRDLGFGSPARSAVRSRRRTSTSSPRKGLRYNRVPHDCHLLADTRGAADRPQSSPVRHRHDHRTVDRLPRLQQHLGPRTSRASPRCSRQNGYATAAFGKWHNTPDWETSPDRPVRPLADRPRIRILVWVPGRRDEPVGTATLPQHHSGRAAEDSPSRATTSPRTSPTTPSSWIKRAEVDRAGQAVLRLLRHRCDARSAPCSQGMDRQVQGPVRSRLGQGPRGDVRAAEAARRRSAEHQTTPRPKEIPAWDSLDADAKQLYARQMEVFAGFLAHTDHHLGRLLDAVAQPAGRGQHADHLRRRRQRPERRRQPDRHDQQHDDPERPAGRRCGATAGNRRDRRAEAREPLSRRLGLGRVDAVPVDEARAVSTSAAPATDWSSHGRRRSTTSAGLRSQFHHVIDIAPTIYEAAGVHDAGSR